MIERIILIGDVHGCIDELEDLLIKHDIIVKVDANNIRFRTPPNQFNTKIIFLGDLFDRGPNSPRVYWLIQALRKLYGADRIIVVRGNHDDKLRRYLKGNNVSIGRGLRMTIDQFKFETNESIRKEVFDFLSSLPYIYEDEAVIAVHAALVNSSKEKVRNELALYGLVDKENKTDENGYLIRHLTWIDKYQGYKPICFGHMVHDVPTAYPSPNSIVYALDTGCVFGGDLSSLVINRSGSRMVSVPARKEYWDRKEK